MTTHVRSAVFTRPQNSYCTSTTATNSVISVVASAIATSTTYPVYSLPSTTSQEHFDHGSTSSTATTTITAAAVAAVANVVSSPPTTQGTTLSATSSVSSNPHFMMPSAPVTTNHNQLTHHPLPPPPQLTRSNGGYPTYYSPLPMEHLPSPSCSPYPLPTPPLTAPIHPLRSYFFPTVVGQQFKHEQLKHDDVISNKSPNHPAGIVSPSDAYSNNNHETLATALLQLQEPVIRASVPAATLVSFAQPSITSPISTFSNVPYSVQSPWRPSWPYLPIMQQQEYRCNPCHICGRTYSKVSTLRTHLKSHSGQKPYQCSICQKSFTQAANLTAHLRTHSGEKPFKCPVCHRGFSQSSSVTTHMRTHSGDRPYKCNVCSKGFADSSTLTKHYRTHTGEKPYCCKVCEARFSQSGNLNRHMRTHQQHFSVQHMPESTMPMDMSGVSMGVSGIGDYGCSSGDISTKMEMVDLNQARV